MTKIEEMERLLREAQVEKQRLLEHRVLSRIWASRRCVCPVRCDSHRLARAGARNGDSPAGLGGREKTTGGTGETAAGGDEQEAKTGGD